MLGDIFLQVWFRTIFFLRLREKRAEAGTGAALNALRSVTGAAQK